MIEPLDDATTCGLSRFLADKQRAIVDEVSRRAAMSGQVRQVHDAFTSQVDPKAVKGNSPDRKVDAFRWYRNVDRSGGTMWRVDKLPPNYAFTDLSDRWEDW